jgi:histidinol-phosphate aminotransferase
MNMLFKKHILESEPYRGGSTRDDIQKAQKMVKLSSNENPIGPSPKAIAAINKHLPSLHEYSHHDDNTLRTELASHYHLHNDQFISANSGLELIDMICRGFLDPGLECIISSPTFMAYKNFAELQGAKVIDVPLSPVDFSISTKKILAGVSEKTRIIFLASPNNPTGAIIPKNALDEIMNNIPKNVVVVFDEVYHHFVRDRKYTTAMTYVEQEKNIIALNSFSKAYGLAGLRIGFAYTTKAIANYLTKLKRPFMINAVSSEAAVAALNDLGHLLATQKMIRVEKRWLYDQLKDLRIRSWPSEGNFILFRAPYDNQEFAKDMLNAGVMLRTTNVFGLPGCIRLSVGDHDANVFCLNAIAKLIGINS